MKNPTSAGLKSVLSLLIICLPVKALAATDQETIAALQSQLAELSARLEALESRQQIRVETYETPVVKSHPAASPSWTDRIKLKGDFRYRHETIDAQFADSTRNRHRIRARPAIVADVTDSVEVGFGLATGSEDPISSNQTLGGAFSSKPIQLDLAYMNWNTPLDGLNVLAGKYKNPLHRAGGNGLLWDSDARPEGVNATYAKGGLKLTGVFNWVSESSSADNVVFGGQASWSTAIGGDNKLLVGAGYYDLSSVQGRAVPFDGDPRGNSVDAQNRYLYGYQDLELFGEFSFHVGDRPITLFANYVENLDAEEFDQGWAIGGAMDFQHGSRPWRLGYVYQDLEPDAVYALFTDSDFIGGGTDGKGHVFRGRYALTDNVILGGTLFINERGEDTTGVAEDYNRLMLDVEFKY